MLEALFCQNCGKEVQPGTTYCASCGAPLPPTGYTPPPPGQYPGAAAQPYVTRRNEGLAAVLSALFPGLGQIYNGQIAKGLVFMVLGVVFATSIIFLIGIILLPVFWIYNIYDAYNTAKQINAGIVKV